MVIHVNWLAGVSWNVISWNCLFKFFCYFISHTAKAMHFLSLAVPAVCSQIAWQVLLQLVWMVFQPELADGAAAEVTLSHSQKNSPALWAPLGFPFRTYQHNTHFIVSLFDRSEVLAFIGAKSVTRLWFYSPQRRQSAFLFDFLPDNCTINFYLGPFFILSKMV